jgi:DNA-binding CsgD family transcriptional regulator
MAKINVNRDFTKNRSDKYQHILVESSCSPDILMEFSETRGIAGYLNMSSYNEEMYELRAELHKELWRIMEEVLTDRQLQVIKMSAKGLTQIEIAKLLGVNQSSITKSINGNCDYRNGKKVYGGAKKKLRKAAAEDPIIQDILDRMKDLAAEMTI